MAITRTWQPTGTNIRASNPGNWSPNGVPQPGDSLQLMYPSQPRAITIRGNDLAGDTFNLFGANLTANLQNRATMIAIMQVQNVGTFNLSGRSTLDLTLRSGAHVGNNTATVNITGTDNFTLHNAASQVTVNIAPDGRWNGTVDLQGWFGIPGLYGKTTVNGPREGEWNNNGASLVSTTDSLVVNTAVVGRGSFNITNSGNAPNVAAATTRMEFISSVGAGQIVTNNGLLILDRPDQFKAHAILAAGTTAHPAEIDLEGLATADSYSFRNDILKLYDDDAGGAVVDRLHLTDATLHGFAVQKGAAGLVSIVAITDPAAPPVGLPLHVA